MVKKGKAKAESAKVKKVLLYALDYVLPIDGLFVLDSSESNRT